MYKYILYIKQILKEYYVFKLKRNPLGEEPGGLRILLGFCLLLCFGILRKDQQHVNKFLFSILSSFFSTQHLDFSIVFYPCHALSS